MKIMKSVLYFSTHGYEFKRHTLSSEPYATV